MKIIVPPPEVNEAGKVVPWPTLGPQVIKFIEDRFVFGPGPLKGQPYKVRNEFKYILMRAYEHYPEGAILQFGSRSVNMSGRRHFDEVNISLAKGSAKTELMALIALMELHPDAPVRFNGYDPKAPGGMAPGRSVVSPYIPLLAPTLDQLEDLAFGAAYEIVQLIDDAGLFDVNKERIMVQGEADSKIVPWAANPNALDGLKPTFQGIDEPHRLFSDRHRKSYEVMKNNLPKRYVDDPWQLTCTTAGDPSEPSVARDQYRQGLKLAAGEVELPRTFFYHRQTSNANALFDTMEQRLTALEEASGPEAFSFRDPIPTAALWDRPGVDKAYLERVWCNRWVQASKSAFDADAFRELGDPSLTIPRGARVTVGFDGAVTHDSTGIVITEVETGIQNVIGLWERPTGDDEKKKGWRVPVGEVEAMMELVFEEFDVLMLFADPPYWTESISRWSGMYPGRVVEYFTNQTNKLYYALRDYNEAIDAGAVAHNGDERLCQHIANAGKNPLNLYDDEGLQKYRLIKISRERKYDLAMAAVLSWQARLYVIKKGAEQVETGFIDVPVRIR